LGETNSNAAENTGSVNDPSYQKGVFERAYRQTCIGLKESGMGGDVQAFRRIIKDRNEKIDEAATLFAAKNGAECQAECSFCCHQMVLCSPLEVFGIARAILDTKSADEIAEIRIRLAKRVPLPLDEQSRYGSDKPCALLQDNRCSIYEHRPSNCRTMLSTSRVACETSLGSGEHKVPFIADPVVISFIMQLGIDYALIKLKGVSTEKVELSRALSLALESFDYAFQSWADGKEPFPGCHAQMGSGPSNQNIAETAAKHCGIA